MGSIYFDDELCLRLWEVTQLKSLVPKARKPLTVGSGCSLMKEAEDRKRELAN